MRRCSFASAATAALGEPDFWFINRHHASCWNAVTGTTIGKTISWSHPALRLVADDHASRLDRAAMLTRGFSSSLRLAPAQIIDGLPWVATADERFGLTRWNRHWRAPRKNYSEPFSLQRLSNHKHLLWYSQSRSISVSRHDLQGQRTHSWSHSGCANWLAVNNDIAWVGTSSSVYGLDCSDLTELVRHEDAEFAHALPWNDNTLLVVNGEALQIIDPKNLTVLAAWQLPSGIQHVGAIAASPDRSHIAVSDNSDVRILRFVE